MSRILLTTGVNFEGYYIQDYIDVLSEEVIFKNSYMKRLFASVSDLISSLNIRDTEMTGATSLIENGKKYVMERLMQKAKNMGANAILGMQFESSFGTDVIRIAISGTAVKIIPNEKKISEKNLHILAKGFGGFPFRIAALNCHIVEKNQSVSLDIYNPEELLIMGVKCDIVLHTSFQDCFIMKAQSFINFQKTQNRHQISSPIAGKIPNDILEVLTRADIIVRSYIENDSVVTVENPEIQTKEDVEFLTKVEAPNVSIEKIIADLEKLSNAREIYEHIKAQKVFSLDIFTPDLLSILERKVKTERLYGNEKEEALQVIKDHFGLFD